MVNLNMTGKLVSNGYSRASSQGAKSAGRSAPKNIAMKGMSMTSAATGPGGKANAKAILQKPAGTLGGNKSMTGKMSGYTSY